MSSNESGDYNEMNSEIPPRFGGVDEIQNNTDQNYDSEHDYGINFNHINETTNAETNFNNNSLFRLSTSINDFIQNPYISNLNINPEALNNNYTNIDSLFEDVEEEMNDAFYQEINYGANVDEVFLNLGYIINNEKEKIRNDKKKIKELKKIFKQYQLKYIKEYNDEIKKWNDSIKIKERKNDSIDINVGGTDIITTSYKTLTKYPTSVLGIFFNNIDKADMPKKDGKIFLDRDANTFKLMLHYLTYDTFPEFPSYSCEKSFFEELHFWQIPIKRNSSHFVFNKDWCAETLSIECNGKVLRKKIPNHGIVFLSPKMNAFSPYLEFHVKMSIPAKNKSHLFVGLVDEAKHKKKYLLSTYWKDSPCSYYWDVWSMQLVKTDSTGQVMTKNGYGCDFEEYETKIALFYDQENRTLSFYKNDIYLGPAFHNVPPNLTPSLDIWFENGIITILSSTQPEEKIFL